MLIALTLVSLAAAGLCLVLPLVWARWATVGSAAVSLALVLVLTDHVGDRHVGVGFLRADAISVIFLLATSFLYLMTALYCLGYLERRPRQREARRYVRLFLVGMNLFAWSMLCAPLMNGLALLWVAIEVTTVVSALLVAIEDTDGATEAAWKYVLIASCGLGIALLATIFMYYAGAQRLGTGFDLAFPPLVAHAASLPPQAVRLSFVLAVLGFGTKVGLVPVHTWLPDAHAEAPTPVSVMLSGSLLAVSLYAIIRYDQIAVGALGASFPHTMLLVFGAASLLLAALYLLGQRDVKRLLAYSSIEHMGLMAIGLSFGASIAVAGVFLHVLAHAAGKGGAFMGAGALVRAFRTKELSAIRDAMGVLPVSAGVFALVILGLSGFPPSGVFRSEFQIVRGGLAQGHHVGAVVLVALGTLAFGGLAVATTRMLFLPASDAPEQEKVPAERNAWLVAPVVVCVLVLLALGLHVPTPLGEVITTAAHQVAGGAP